MRGYLSAMGKHQPIDGEAKGRIMSAGARNPDSATAQGFNRRAQSAADRNANEEDDDE